jgi:protein-S-isoprenylcysteine O-methyltransferase Ste14
MDPGTGTMHEKQEKTVVFKIGPMRLTGIAAVVALLVVLGLIGVLVFLMKPTLRMSLAAALWIVLTIYWTAAAQKAAPAKRTESRESRRLHASLLYASLLLLFVPLPGLRARFVPLRPMIVAAGLAVQIGAFLLAMWARRYLGRNWSGAISANVDHQLIRTGPYRLLRHPIYSGLIGMYVGTALVSGELHALIAVGIIVAAYWRKIRMEERHLVTLFGPDYDDYRRRSWALIPGLF